MAQVIWTEEAVVWLEEIFEYIARDNPAAAGRVVSGIYEKVQKLRSFSRIGFVYRSEQDGDIRVILYGHYRIAYFVTSSDNVIVLGVFHGALEIDRYL